MSDATKPLPATALRWRCDPADFSFTSTAELDPGEGIVGQTNAVEALRFGLEFDAPGQNVFVRGLEGTGRSTLVQKLMATCKSRCLPAPDRVYVFNFKRSDRPTLLSFPRGQGPNFRRLVDGLIKFISSELGEGLTADMVKARSKEIDAKAQQDAKALTEPFEKELKDAGFALMTSQAGPTTRHLIVPMHEGQPVLPERMQTLLSEGTITQDTVAEWGKQAEAFGERMGVVSEKLQEIGIARIESHQNLITEEARALLSKAAAGIRSAFPGTGVRKFLDAVVDDVIEKRLGALSEGKLAFVERYRVNVILTHENDDGCPAIVETAPSMQALLGTIDRLADDPEDDVYTPQMMIRPGSLVNADGGYLVLDGNDLIQEPGAWKSLVRTLRTGRVELVPMSLPVPWRGAALKPDPVPVNVKVILIGDAKLYYLLDSLDQDFPALFKVLVDFDSVIPRDQKSMSHYATILASIARDENRPPYTREAVAALCEHGARIAAQGEKLTARFGRLADLAREAAFLASTDKHDAVSAEHVRSAVRRTKRRANLPSRRFQEMISRGVIRIATEGAAVGQVNGLAVMQAGQLTYGFPGRITASVGPGSRGTINIEQEAALSGRIHTKGFQILGGLLRTLLQTNHPITFTASIAFEQSYGGVDGDSASGVQFCCLLSALTGIPARQDLAMTGAIDQVGNVLPIGGVNEKIEGFYDACSFGGLSRTQGVIIPRANADDLMLRDDVVKACADGTFAVYAVARIEEALKIMLATSPGTRDAEGRYPDESVLGRANARVYELWRQSARPEPYGSA